MFFHLGCFHYCTFFEFSFCVFNLNFPLSLVFSIRSFSFHFSFVHLSYFHFVKTCGVAVFRTKDYNLHNQRRQRQPPPQPKWATATTANRKNGEANTATKGGQGGTTTTTKGGKGGHHHQRSFCHFLTLCGWRCFFHPTWSCAAFLLSFCGFPSPSPFVGGAAFSSVCLLGDAAFSLLLCVVVPFCFFFFLKKLTKFAECELVDGVPASSSVLR